MKNKDGINVQIEYGEENLKKILLELLKEQYINNRLVTLEGE